MKQTGFGNRGRRWAGMGLLIVILGMVTVVGSSAVWAEGYELEGVWPTTSFPDHPNSIAVDASGNVYIVDYEACTVSKYDSSGALLARWGSQGFFAGQFYNPEGIAVDGSGNVYVVDYFICRVQKFDSDGTYLTG